MIDYEEDWIAVLLFRTAGSVSGRACCFAIPATILTVGLLFLDDYVKKLREEFDLLDFNQGTIWSAVTAMVVFLIGFRTRNAYGRFWEGTGLLHQMRGEWFDTVSNCVTFSIRAKNKNPEAVMKFRHTLVRLMSLAHGNALEEISDNQFELDTIDAHGLDVGTLRHLKDCHERCKFNKVEVLLHLIQSLITTAHMDGVIDIPPPILSRVFQTISRGFVNLLNSKKITDTKFPFPYVQLIAGLLLAFSILTPIVLSSFIPNKVIAAAVTFIPVFGVASLNAIAQELENPFGMDDNDLPIAHFQEEMDRCLLMLLHPSADIIATTSPKVEMDFDRLLSSFEGGEELSRLSNVSPTSPKLDSKADKVKRFDTEALASADEEVIQPATPQSFTPTKNSSAAWDKGSAGKGAQRKQKRFATEALQVDEISLPISSPISSVAPTPTEITAVWNTAPAMQQPMDGVEVRSSFQDAPPLGASDLQDLSTELKMLLTTNISTFVKSLESLNSVLQHQVDMLSAASYVIPGSNSGSVQAHTLAPSRFDLEAQFQAGSSDLRKAFEEMGKKWESLENKQPTWHPVTDSGASSSRA